MIRKRILLVLLMLFFIVSVADIFAVIIQNKTMEIIFKPLLMLSLIAIYFLSTRKVNLWLVAGLFFAFLGDVLLLDQKKYFVFGIACFLVTHVLYIKLTIDFIKNISFTRIVFSLIPYILYFLAIMYVVYDNLKDMLVPVVEFGLVISIFGSVAFINYQKQKTKANFLLLLSATFFVISDGFIVLNIYTEYSKILDFFVILLYITAQYLIVRAIILKDKYVEAIK